MTYTTAQGPPKLYASHLWTPYGGSPTITMNDRGYPTATYPYCKVTAIGGWRDLPETSDRRAPRTYGVGEIPYPNDVLGKTLSYKLEERALTEISLDTLENALIQAFANQNQEGVMTVTAFDSSIAWTFHARTVAFTSQEDFTWEANRSYPYSRVAELTLRMSDPLFYTGGVGYV